MDNTKQIKTAEEILKCYHWYNTANYGIVYHEDILKAMAEYASQFQHPVPASTDMTSDRIKQIQEATAYPNSVSVKQALLQVWNECEQSIHPVPATGKNKPFIVANVKDILELMDKDEVSFSRGVEMFNEVAANYYNHLPPPALVIST